jgi:hypothetical protein
MTLGLATGQNVPTHRRAPKGDGFLSGAADLSVAAHVYANRVNDPNIRRASGLSSIEIIPPPDDSDHNPDQTTGHEQIA